MGIASKRLPKGAFRGRVFDEHFHNQIRGHITYLILAIEKITAERNGYVNELSYVSPDSYALIPPDSLIPRLIP